MILTRIQGSSMGFANFQKPIIQTPGMYGMDFKMPSLPKFDFPLDAGSAPAGGGTGAGAAPPSAPLPTPAPAQYPGYQPAYLFPVQEVPAPAAPAVPAVPPVQVTVAGSPVVPTWALVGGALLAGVVLAKLL